MKLQNFLLAQQPQKSPKIFLLQFLKNHWKLHQILRDKLFHCETMRSQILCFQETLIILWNHDWHQRGDPDNFQTRLVTLGSQVRAIQGFFPHPLILMYDDLICNVCTTMKSCLIKLRDADLKACKELLWMIKFLSELNFQQKRYQLYYNSQKAI